MTKNLLLLASIVGASVTANASTRVEFIFDDSGSMAESQTASGVSYCEAAKTALQKLIGQIRAANDIVDIKSINLTPLNARPMSIENKPAQIDQLLTKISAMTCSGGTPLSETISRIEEPAEMVMKSAPSSASSVDDLLIFTFTDGENNTGIRDLVNSIGDLLKSKQSDLIDFKFYNVGRPELSNDLNQSLTGRSIGRRFSATTLTDMAQLNDSLKESMGQFIDRALVRKIRTSLDGLYASINNQNSAEQIITQAEQLNLNSNADVVQLIAQMATLKANIDSIAKTNDVKKLSDEFAEVFGQLGTLLKQGNASLQNLNSEISNLNGVLSDFSKVDSKIKESEEQAAKTLAYLAQVEKDNAQEFAQLAASQKNEIEMVKQQLDHVVAKSNELRTRANTLEAKITAVRANAESSADLYTQLSKSIAKQFETLRAQNGSAFQEKLNKALGEKGYTVFENGEIVYYGTHFMMSGGGGGGGSNITVRNKGTIIMLDGGGSGSSGGSGGGGKFINDGLIINGVTRMTKTDGAYTIFLNNGEVINIPSAVAEKLKAGYFWTSYAGGYLVISSDFASVYYVSQSFIDLIRKNRSSGSRLAGFGKVVGSGLVEAIAITGSLIVDSFGSARSFATDRSHVGFELTSRNIEIENAWVKNGWIQLTSKGAGVVSVPQAILPAVLDIEATTAGIKSAKN